MHLASLQLHQRCNIVQDPCAAPHALNNNNNGSNFFRRRQLKGRRIRRIRLLRLLVAACQLGPVDALTLSRAMREGA